MLIRRLTVQSPQRCSLTAGTYCFHYLLESGICYLILSEGNFPRLKAFSFLEEVHNQFNSQYANDVYTVSRPYGFIEFGTCYAYFNPFLLFLNHSAILLSCQIVNCKSYSRNTPIPASPPTYHNWILLCRMYNALWYKTSTTFLSEEKPLLVNIMPCMYATFYCWEH